MNRRITGFILAFVLTLATIIPFAPKKAEAAFLSESVYASAFVSQSINFNNAVDQSLLVLGDARVLVLSAAALGIPVSSFELNQEFFGLTLSDLLMAEFIARSAPNGRLVNVVQMLNDGRSFGQIAFALNVPLRPVILRISSFIGVLNTEVGVETGTITITREQITIELERSIRRIDNTLRVLAANLGRNVVEGVTLLALSAETGLTVQQLIEMKQLAFAHLNFELTKFVLSTLVHSSLSAATFTTIDFNALASTISSEQILLLFGNGGIPVQTLSGRMVFVSRVIVTNNDTTQG